ncbi:unnamed protein product, partial [Adineta steineri]
MSRVNEAFSQLRDALNGRQLPYLDPEYYAEAHLLFELCSNQRALTANWLCKWTADHFRDSSSMAILSVGCGKGIVDFQVATHLIADKSSLMYVGVEPNVDDANICQHLLDSTDGVEGSVLVGKWPDCASKLHDKQFDVILFIHCLYHVVDVGEALDEALCLLKPHGQGPCTGLNELCTTLGPPQHDGTLPFWWAVTIKST